VAESNVIFSSYSLNFPYWIIFEGAPLESMLKAGAQSLYQQPNLMGLQVSSQWTPQWNAIMQLLASTPESMVVRAAIIPADHLPSLQEIELSLKPIADIDTVANHIWLLDYLSDGRLVCFMQPVIGRSREIVGYEAFARIDAPDGSLISGGQIMQASRALQMEFQVDRVMHQQAVQSFMGYDLQGILFVNFLTGFLHLPEIYLEGLSQAVENSQLAARKLVLDVPLSNYGSNIPKLKSIAEYCRRKGFAMALDDVATIDGLAHLLEEVEPAYVKLDTALGSTVTTPEGQQAVKDIIKRAHVFGAVVVAESVETEAQFQAYLAADVDLFQGYLFGAPERNPLR
jgi:EAL domain-containing protein (putative c-di-GMP-specific phosphodiesterase class I)